MELRVRPKQKSFINGGWRYNPVIDADHIQTMRAAAREYTPFIADVVAGRATWESSEWDDGRPLGALIRMRARLFRMAQRDRVRLIRGA